MANLIEALQNHHHLTPCERSVANFILKDPQHILDLSIYELAGQCHTSPATVTRLCKKCQASDFRDFKIELAKNCSELGNAAHCVNVNVPFRPDDSDASVAHSIAQLYIETIEETVETCDAKQISRAVDLLLNANSIYGVALSGNYIRLRDFQLKLLRINYSVNLLDLQAEQYYLAYHASQADAAVLISYSGRTAEIVNDAKLFRINHTPSIAITADDQSPLAMYAQIILKVPMSETAKMKVSDFSSQIAISYVLNTLYACLYNRHFEQNYHDQTSTPVAHF